MDVADAVYRAHREELEGSVRQLTFMLFPREKNL